MRAYPKLTTCRRCLETEIGLVSVNPNHESANKLFVKPKLSLENKLKTWKELVWFHGVIIMLA